MRHLNSLEIRQISGAGRSGGTSTGEYEGDCPTKNNNGYGNGAESGPPPGNSVNNPQLTDWNSGKKGPR